MLGDFLDGIISGFHNSDDPILPANYITRQLRPIAVLGMDYHASVRVLTRRPWPVFDGVIYTEQTVFLTGL